MKSLKTIIIAGAVLIVFIIASLVVTHLPSGSGDTTAESVSQEEASSAETAYIVNRDYVTAVDQKEHLIELEGALCVPLSRGYRENFVEGSNEAEPEE